MKGQGAWALPLFYDGVEHGFSWSFVKFQHNFGAKYVGENQVRHYGGHIIPKIPAPRARYLLCDRHASLLA